MLDTQSISSALTLLYRGGPLPSTTAGAHTVAPFALKKHATDTRGPTLLDTTRCTGLLNLSLDTSCRKSPTFTTSDASPTAGTSTHAASSRSSSTSTWRPPTPSWSSTVRKLGSECLTVPIVRRGSGHAG
uniref:Predicted protein n=1 Tax=Hordeum vulgare subsp. vulgare TaxID=112509 RepID=F2EIV8_HORVV|nr:predicted protein [Hordeum vulgare subsp. vulgare]